MSASAFVGNMHRLAAFVLLSMVVLRLTAGATTCDADPKKGLFGYEGACFDLIDRLDSKHGEVCISTIVRAPTSSRPGGTCLRAKFTVPSTDESILKLRAGVHKKGDPITSKSSRYTRKRTVASLNSPHVHKASLVFCPSAISVLEIPCCGSDLQFLGFAVVSSPGAIINGPNQVDEQLQLKAYISPQTTTEGICDETRIGGGRKEFLCTLKLTCDSCPNSACNDSGTCVRTSDYACGDLGEEFKDPDTGACGCRCDPSKTDVCVDETNGCVKVSDFESQSCSSSEVAVIDPSDNSCQCEAVACGENECFDPIQGCLSLESSAFCDAGGPGSLLYKDDHGSCSCCPQGSCFSVDSDAGGIKCISEADFGSDCTFSSAITDSEGLCQCCASLPDHCFDTDQQKCVGPAERKTACDAEAAADPFGRQFAPAKAAPGACECCPGVGDNENSCVNADQQCVSRQAFSSSNCNGLFPHADASGNCECCRTAVGEDQCVIFGQCIDNDKYAAGFCGSELGASLGAPDENGFCHCVSRCPADQCLDDSNTCVSVSSDSAKAVCESLPKIPQHVLAVKNENTEKCECCGADSSDCVNLDGGIDNATCVSTSAYSSTTCSSSEVVFTDGGQCGCCKVAGESADSCFLPGELFSPRQCTKLADFKKSSGCGNPYADSQQNYECRCCDSVDNCVTPNGECQPIASGISVHLTCPGFPQGIVFLDEDEPGKCQCCGDHESTCINFRTKACDTLDRFAKLFCHPDATPFILKSTGACWCLDCPEGQCIDKVTGTCKALEDWGKERSCATVRLDPEGFCMCTL